MIKLCEAFAWIPETLRGIFLHQARGQRHAFAGRFHQRIELLQGDRTSLYPPEIKRMNFAHAKMSFSLASSPRGALVELLHAAIKSSDLVRTRELRASRWRPCAFVPAG